MPDVITGDKYIDKPGADFSVPGFFVLRDDPIVIIFRSKSVKHEEKRSGKPSMYVVAKCCGLLLTELKQIQNYSSLHYKIH